MKNSIKPMSITDLLNFLTSNELLNQNEKVSLQYILDLIRATQDGLVCSIGLSDNPDRIHIHMVNGHSWCIKLFNIQEEI